MPAKLEEGKTWEEIHDHIYSQIGHQLKKSEDKTFKKWFMYREKIGFLFDSIMILRCFRIWQEIQKHLDHFIVISGREGFGKTTLSFQIAAWVNPDGFELGNVCYGAKRYLDILSIKAVKYRSEDKTQSESLVLDEGTELLSRESLNVTNRSLIKTFFVQRTLKFLVIVNIPNFHMLDIAIRMHRVRTLIEVTHRAKYKCITGKGISIIAKEGQLTKQVSGIRIPNGTFWQGYFRKDFPPMIDRELYDNHKIKSIRNMLETMKDDVIQTKFVPVFKVSKEIGITVDTIVNMIKRQEYDGKQIGARWFLTRKSYEKMITTDK